MRRALRIATATVLLVLAAAAVQAQEPKDGFFTASDGVKIHYLTLGDQGSWVVLIHGYSDSARRMWFSTGIAQSIAKTHRVVAIDNRNHGQSDKPQPGGSGRADDVTEMMDYLKIDKAHIHGYSMGGGFVGQLLGKIPQRFITAGFGGSGMTETDPELRAKATALDEALPKATGADAEAMDRFRARVSTARGGTTSGAQTTTGSGRGTAATTTQAASGRAQSTTTTTTTRTTTTPPGAAPNPTASVDLSKLSIPILAVNRSFDNPYGKTMRLWREVKVFQNVILPNRTHLTAIGVGAPVPQQYVDEITNFINTHDSK